MKKLFLFLAVASTAFFTSCSNDDENNDPVATSIVLAANVTTIQVGASVTLTVTNNLDQNVTASSTFYSNDVALTSATFTPTAVGTYTLHAVNGSLLSNDVVVTVEAVPVVADNSFVVDNVNFETPIAAFAFNGVYNGINEGEYVIVWDFNPYEEVGTNYPNDLYLTMVLPIVPTGTDAEGNPTFTIEYPTTGTFTYDVDTFPSLVDAWIIADDVALLPEDPDERAALIQSLTLNITALDLESETTNLAATYNITLTDGTVINGEYNGETGIYDASGKPSSKNSTAVKPSFNVSKAVKISSITNLKSVISRKR